MKHATTCARTAFLAILLTFSFAISSTAYADSAGTYRRGSSTVSVETQHGPFGDLQVRLTSGDGSTTDWTSVDMDPNSDDRRDVLTSDEIPVGSDVYRWNRGRLQKKVGNGWGNTTKLNREDADGRTGGIGDGTQNSSSGGPGSEGQGSLPKSGDWDGWKT